MRYLNNNLNTKTSVNENYGREYSTGSPDARGITELWKTMWLQHVSDRLEGRPATLSTVFVSVHTILNKVFHGNTIITGRSGRRAAGSRRSLNMILDQPATAKYIVIHCWFVSTHYGPIHIIGPCRRFPKRQLRDPAGALAITQERTFLRHGTPRCDDQEHVRPLCRDTARTADHLDANAKW
jgi:hypothetical protein